MIQIELYSNNVWKQKLWQEHVRKTNVEQTKGNWKFYPYLYPYLYPIKDLAQGSFHIGFHVGT